MSTMKRLTVEQIRKRLKDRNLSAVAKAAGVSNDTLYRLMHGVCTPTPATLTVLSLYLSGES